MRVVVSRLSLLLTALFLGGMLAQAVLLPSRAQTANPPSLETVFKQSNLSEIVPQIEQNWESQYEEYFRKSFPDTSITVEIIANKLSEIGAQTQTKPALVYVVPLENKLELVLLTPGKPPIHKRVTEASHTRLLKQVKEYTNAVTNPSLTNTKTYLEPSQQLYKWIVTPIEPDLRSQNIDTLIFCLGKGLRTLPLAALHDGQQFLAEKYSISRIPAFKLTEIIYTDLKTAQILAMGASEFKDQQPLPAVPVEITAIAEKIGRGRSFLNQEFTQQNLRSQRQQQPFKIIHLATHADFQPGNPNNSYIQFWDNKVTLDKLGQLNLNSPPVDLLVLSACRTAIGDENAELGFAGLAVQAGVKSAIASLWYVSDEGTLALMTEFYRQLQTAPIKAAALKQAQIEMLKGRIRIQNGQLQGKDWSILLPEAIAKIQNQNLSHPYYWAAFTVVGSPW
jgi:CHAT domain-containing protein